MKHFACRYSLIKFVPYSETGEFANIGVLLVCPETRYWGFRMETSKSKRYTDFFEGVTQGLYREAVNSMRAELTRLLDLGVNESQESLVNAFDVVTHPREAIVSFSPPRGRLTGDPEQELTKLFKHFVEFGFLRDSTPEKKLVKRIQDLVNSFNLEIPFKESQIGDPGRVSVQLPLVQTIKNRQVKAIKPLYLGQNSVNDIYTHGEAWLGKIRRLRNKVGWQGDLLITIDGLSDSQTTRKAQDDIIAELSQSERVEKAANKEELKSFCLQ